MEFRLPTNLQTELLAYDPVLKRLAREQAAAQTPDKPKGKPKYPVGKPPVLIPSDIVGTSVYNNAIDHINAQPAPQRYQGFIRFTGTIPDVQETMYAILYHWEGLWVAAWLPPEDKKDEYIYGYTYCYKDNASTVKRLGYGVKSDESMKAEQVGRSCYKIKTVYITKQLLLSGNNAYTNRNWYVTNGYTQKGRHMADVVNAFNTALLATVPTWSDGPWYQRMLDQHNLFNTIFRNVSKPLQQKYFQLCQEQYRMSQDDWQLNVDTFFALVDISKDYTDYLFASIGLRQINNARTVFNTPFFRKWIQSQCDEVNTTFNDINNNSRKKVEAPLKRIYRLADNITWIRTIWADTPIDYFQNNMDVLIGTRTPYAMPSAGRDWLRTHMPVESLFHMMTKHYLECVQEAEANPTRRRWSWDDDMDHWFFRFSALDDTLSMLTRIFENNKTIEPPKRWRITEFHDHVQAENWKIQNPNQSLPQDLLPQPIKIKHNNKNWSFFQPIDTHQLGQWGQAVRNCVGNASNYADGVRKKNHFIVLGMLDGKPTFTIQLTVRAGVMSVEQIVGYANARLSEQDRNEYTEVFRQVLQERENQLASDS